MRSITLYSSSYWSRRLFCLAVENSALSFLSFFMYMTLFFSVGKKKAPPTPLHRGLFTIHPLTNQTVRDWLIATRVGVNDPNPSHTQTLSIFRDLRNYSCQNQFIIPFTHRAGGRVKILNSSWIQSVRRFPGSWLPLTSFSYFTCCHYLTD